VQSALCVVRPPGHHAECGCAMGFSLFGNVAVAAAEARQRGWAARVLIVDWDVHHGNGTQRMFDDDPTVLYVSVHRHDEGRFYPGGNFGHYTSHGEKAGTGFSVNIPWDVKGVLRRGGKAPGDAELLYAFKRVIMPIALAFNPEVVLISAGFDSAEGDPLGGCKVSPQGFHALTSLLMGLAGGRVVLALEGGYNLESISASMAACAGALLGDPPPEPEAMLPGSRRGPAVTERGAAAPCELHAEMVDRCRSHLAQFWPSALAADDEAPQLHAPVEHRTANEVPPCALAGSLMDMHFALREHAKEFGGNFEELRRKHEALLFKLRSAPANPRLANRGKGKTALRQSFASQCAKGTPSPLLVPVVQLESPQQAVREVGRVLDLGAHGVWLLNFGQASVATGGISESSSLQPQRINLKARADATPHQHVGLAQLEGLVACFSAVREAFPDAWLGLRIPQLNAAQLFTWLAERCPSADGAWLDDLPCSPAEVEWETVGFGALAKRLAVRVKKWHALEDCPALEATLRNKQRCGWLGLVCGSIAVNGKECMHHQADDDSMSEVCEALLLHWADLALAVCDVVVTHSASSSAAMAALGKTRPTAWCPASSGARADELRAARPELLPDLVFGDAARLGLASLGLDRRGGS